MEFSFVLDVLDNLSKGVKVMYDFLFASITIGTTEITLMSLLAGVGLVAVLIYSFVK